MESESFGRFAHARRCARVHPRPGGAFWLACVALAATIGCREGAEQRKQQLFESGSAFARAGRNEEAAIQFRNALQLDPAFGDARAALAAAYERQGDLTRALGEYVRAADLLPERSDLQLTAGTYLLRAGRFDDALARADAILKRDPVNVPAHLLRGNALGGQKDFEQALSAMEEALRLEPRRSETYSQIGSLELVRGRQAEAERAFARAVSLAPQSVDVRLTFASFYWATNRPVQAETQLKDALGVDPRHAGANRAMALLQMAKGRTVDAEKYLQVAAESDPRPYSVIALADYYLAVGRAADAIARLEPLASRPQKIGGVRQRLARAYFDAGHRQAAETLVDRLLDENPRDVEALLIRGRVLLAKGQPDEALTHVRAAVDTAPSYVPAQFALGKLYAARGDAAGAEKAFREVLRLNPRAAAAQLELSRLRLASGHTSAAIQLAEASAKNAPATIGTSLAVVRSLIAAKNLARAEAEMARVRPQGTHVAAFHVQAGVLASLRHDSRRARESFEQARTLDPHSLDALAGLVALDLRAGDRTAAKARVEDALRAGVATTDLLLLAARTHASAGDMVATERYLRRVIDTDPAALPAYAMLGRMYLSQKKLEEARREFEALAARQSDPVAAQTMIGIILQAQGNDALARKQFERVVALDRRASVAANNLAWLYAEAGDNLDAALDLAQTALSASPDTPEILDTLGWVHYRRDDAAQAIPLFRRCLEKAPHNEVCRSHLAIAQLKAAETAAARAQ